ncbi:hypothetical protein HC028_15550 [Planosporangium flavigriseum]|uniref:Uncharacterized protein n=1 Tax=Planosporangium flavigriseum TaxID=373681 RepID=A0A8J3LMS5_9ACTN|nr:hypothetical protein [Planosporangium flavigriseum]NJC65906.1 hypothetical protein [Planosporangium flavigriseum]GIG75612.1 hypothetical protein Pfl04_40160 [Planosporangium flavigriseum]
MGESRRPTEVAWVFRPSLSHQQTQRLRGLSGKPVYGVGPLGDDGRVEVVLQDGTRVRATPAEVVAE